MAHTLSLPDDAEDEIVKQIGELLPGQFMANPPAEGDVTLGETFEVWMLEGDAVRWHAASLRDLARPMSRLHHQVYVREKAKLYARSTPLAAEPGSWRVTEVFESELAGNIDKAIETIDEIDSDRADDSLVHLLVVPTYQTYAFWLLRDSWNDGVLVLDHPPEFTSLSRDRLLSQGEFLEALRGERPIIGRIRP